MAAAKKKLTMTIEVSGENMMGDALCRVRALLTQGKKVVKEFEYDGPIASADTVFTELTELFDLESA